MLLCGMQDLNKHASMYGIAVKMWRFTCRDAYLSPYAPVLTSTRHNTPFLLFQLVQLKLLHGGRIQSAAVSQPPCRRAFNQHITLLSPQAATPCVQMLQPDAGSWSVACCTAPSGRVSCCVELYQRYTFVWKVYRSCSLQSLEVEPTSSLEQSLRQEYLLYKGAGMYCAAMVGLGVVPPRWALCTA